MEVQDKSENDNKKEKRTTIKLRISTKNSLKHICRKGETYDHLVRKLVWMWNGRKENEEG